MATVVIIIIINSSGSISAMATPVKAPFLRDPEPGSHLHMRRV